MDTIPYWYIKELLSNIIQYLQKLSHQIESDGWFQKQKVGKSSSFQKEVHI